MSTKMSNAKKNVQMSKRDQNTQCNTYCLRIEDGPAMSEIETIFVPTLEIEQGIFDANSITILACRLWLIDRRTIQGGLCNVG